MAKEFGDNGIATSICEDDYRPAIDLLSATVVAAIGPVTAEAARQLGLTVQVVPERFNTEALVDALIAHFRLQTPDARLQP